MDDNKQVDRAASDASKVTNYNASKWTNEKHKSFLNSIEASFIQQLHNSDYNSNDTKPQPFGQFKVQHKGFRENLQFKEAENENESHRLCENPWIRHFKSNPNPRTSAHNLDNNKVSHSLKFTNKRLGRGASSSKQMSHFCSQEIRKVSIGNVTEVSCQNFEDIEVNKKEVNKRCHKKRAISGISPISDQVVPFVTEEETKDMGKMEIETMGNSIETDQPNNTIFDGC